MGWFDAVAHRIKHEQSVLKRADMDATAVVLGQCLHETVLRAFAHQIVQTLDRYYLNYRADTVDPDLYDVQGRVPYFRYTQRF